MLASRSISRINSSNTSSLTSLETLWQLVKEFHFASFENKWFNHAVGFYISRKQRVKRLIRSVHYRIDSGVTCSSQFQYFFDVYCHTIYSTCYLLRAVISTSCDSNPCYFILISAKSIRPMRFCSSLYFNNKFTHMLHNNETPSWQRTDLKRILISLNQ